MSAEFQRGGESAGLHLSDSVARGLGRLNGDLGDTAPAKEDDFINATAGQPLRMASQVPNLRACTARYCS